MLRKTADEIGQLEENVQSASAVIIQLEKDSDQVSEIVDVIKSIADSYNSYPNSEIALTLENKGSNHYWK